VLEAAQLSMKEHREVFIEEVRRNLHISLERRPTVAGLLQGAV
jgi:hypothetical protein